MKKETGKSVLILGVVFVSMLMVSTVTAVPQTHSIHTIDVFKKVEKTKNPIDKEVLLLYKSNILGLIFSKALLNNRDYETPIENIKHVIASRISDSIKPHLNVQLNTFSEVKK